MSSSVMESGVSLFSFLYSSHTGLYFPLKTHVLSQNPCKLLSTVKQFSNSHKAQLPILTRLTVFYPVYSSSSSNRMQM